MKSDPLANLLKRARATPSAGDALDESAPPGFATRIVALAREQASATTWSARFERKAWQALVMAGGIAALSVVVNLAAVKDSIEQEVLEAEDPITAMWDLS